MGAPKLTNLEIVADISAKKDKKREKSAAELAKYFYKITNHEELFRMGKGFLEEVKKGVKNFAFTSTGYKNSQQRTILGLCCYFDQNDTYKIAIISDHLLHGVFNDLVEASVSNAYDLEMGKDKIEYCSFYHHFDFINYSQFAKFYENHLYTKSFDSEIAKVLEKYDIIFWDIPEMDKMKMNPHFYYRISHFYDSMTMIVSQNTSTGKQVESIKKFFSNYNVNLNGVLFDSTASSDTKKQKKFLGIF